MADTNVRNVVLKAAAEVLGQPMVNLGDLTDVKADQFGQILAKAGEELGCTAEAIRAGVSTRPLGYATFMLEKILKTK